MGKRNDDIFEEPTTSESKIDLFVQNPAAKPPCLEQLKGPGSPRRIMLTKERMVVGRSREVDVFVDSSKVSREHMMLKRTGAETRCLDLKSRNGIYLNGVKIHSAALREGDTLQLGEAVFLFHEGA
jgi:pSer/pThr/pTyr-binding forkhead associated (FHA) protein